ncbi:MAG: hypothetical protein CMP76_17240 [Flavobacterium sp.]|uniref:HK97-gp10 family putative phage morphogenesis protein n=1 Tax=Flavobacterium sp. TaxID=239 RepID=UPI000C48355F|nr:HK97-gp10 family putative phage morphogenesis protein [Flavobacterium sp.]MBF05024.1 hypothetical protein [Flavobacterium sp.]|tara:strand:+ start:148 stop:681 length:534 start_codon:yes stop_codon:yes gene_type:complete
MSKPLVKIEGFEELVSKVKRIANDKQKKQAIIPVLRAVASGTVKVAKNEAPVSKKAHIVSGKRTKKKINPGNLKKAIGIILGKRGKSKENPTVYVGPRAKGSFDGFYGGWVEKGHNVYAKGFKRKRTKGVNTGAAKSKTKAIPFMQRAYNQTKGQVTSEAEKKVARVIQKQIDKLSK